MPSFLSTPPRPPKPRDRGISHVMDTGLPLTVVEGILESAAEYIDIIKLGWGTSLITKDLDAKLALYGAHAIPVVCGGTLFEAAYARDLVDDYKRWLTRHRITHIEIGEELGGLVDEIAHDLDVGRVIFDAPSKAAQAWFIRRFGAEVNLGNVAPNEVIGLETLRLGLRADTLKAILLD